MLISVCSVQMTGRCGVPASLCYTCDVYLTFILPLLIIFLYFFLCVCLLLYINVSIVYWK